MTVPTTTMLVPHVNGVQPLVVKSHRNMKVKQSQLGVSPAQPTSLKPQKGSETPCVRLAHVGRAAASAQRRLADSASSLVNR